MGALTNEEQAMIIAKNLRQLRKKHGFTQQQVANAIGITHVAYRYYETGKRLMLITSLVRLAYFFDVSVETLLQGTLEAMRKPD